MKIFYSKNSDPMLVEAKSRLRKIYSSLNEFLDSKEGRVIFARLKRGEQQRITKGR